jgi:uncharacterized OB-fold protein
MRIVPGIDELTTPYWQAASEHRLVMQYCGHCGFTGYPPVPRCPRCHGGQLTWREVSGRGTVHSFTVVHHSVHPVTANALPYVLVLVSLDEGPRMLTNLRDCAAEEVRVGLEVEVTFEDLGGGIGLPQFRPAGASIGDRGTAVGEGRG